MASKRSRVVVVATGSVVVLVAVLGFLLLVQPGGGNDQPGTNKPPKSGPGPDGGGARINMAGRTEILIPEVVPSNVGVTRSGAGGGATAPMSFGGGGHSSAGFASVVRPPEVAPTPCGGSVLQSVLGLVLSLVGGGAGC